MEEKKKKSILKKWWFWLLVLAVIGAAGSSGNKNKSNTSSNIKTPNTSTSTSTSTTTAQNSSTSNTNSPTEQVSNTDKSSNDKSTTTASSNNSKSYNYVGMGMSLKQVQQILLNLKYDFKYEYKDKGGNDLPVAIGTLNNYPITIALNGYADNLKSVALMYAVNKENDDILDKCAKTEIDLLKNIFPDKKLGTVAAVWSASTLNNAKGGNLGPYDKNFGNWNVSCVYSTKDNAVLKLISISASSSDSNKNTISEQDAAKLLLSNSKLINSNDKNLKISFNKIDKGNNGKQYYVYKVYDDMGDHTAAIGYYGVEIHGDGFYDFINDKVIN